MTPTETIEIPTPGHLPEAAARFATLTRGFSVFAFDAPMGAGKTTFINALARHLGVEADPTGSPTFAILNEYADARGNPIYHFDLYRLDGPEEVAETGFIDYIDSGHLCLIEWPDRAEGLLVDDETVRVTIDPDPLTGARLMTLHYPAG
ncbi:MAG: tRNA (adenosine(37)-N6)-threonylcarbamoyltransferase complex ATPase subunit type 1 TsaE [Pseudoflavonifractor sp.]|nr:tRNA (adenosine(37)-N6)-threonylcarbamoyltransferase complex ATPase subunit type 1 TsaE [Alloprevotella sp.]MCM1116983.1 tRNA (adenosine(37)-N6)-threonylcarbamoyltransferase complex ATPase subunit type 1 TsaE [Pseudoflavonifractor sp.]